MHESNIVADLIREAAARAGGSPERISMLRVEIGAMAPYTPAAIDHGLRHTAGLMWNTTPEVVIALSDDPTDSGALGVTLVSIGTEG